MPVYKDKSKGKGRWKVVLFHKGRRHDWIVRGSKEEAEDFEARKRTEFATADPAADVRVVPTFSDFCVNRYRSHAEMHLKASSWRNRQYTLTTLDEHFGALRLSEITTVAIEAFKAKRQRAKIRPSTINDELKTLLAVVNYARQLGYPVGKFVLKKLPVRGQRKAHAWTADEIGKLYAACTEKAPDVLPLVVFLANTGCRRGEAIALEWENVDLARGLIRIFPSLEWQPKDNEAREVPINDALLPWLQGARRSDRWVFPSTRKVDGKPQPFVFWPQRKFDKARKHAKLTGGPHTLRHTYATHFLSTTPDLYLLAKVLGHSHARVTELYAHLLPDSMSRAARAVSFPTALTPAALEVASRWVRHERAITAGLASGRKRRGEKAPASTSNVVSLDGAARVGQASEPRNLAPDLARSEGRRS